MWMKRKAVVYTYEKYDLSFFCNLPVGNISYV